MRFRTQLDGFGHALAFLLFRADPAREGGFLARDAFRVAADAGGVESFYVLHLCLNLDNLFRFSRPLRLHLLPLLFSFCSIERTFGRTSERTAPGGLSWRVALNADQKLLAIGAAVADRAREVIESRLNSYVGSGFDRHSVLNAGAPADLSSMRAAIFCQVPLASCRDTSTRVRRASGTPASPVS